MSATFAAPTTPPSAVKVAAADAAAAGYTQEDSAYSAAQEPPSPCPSASGSELSFTSETDASSATDLTTPPTSPTRATAQQFRKGSAGSQVSAELASAQQPPPPDSQAIASSPSLDGLLASLSIDGGAAQNQAQAKLDAFFGSSVAGRRPSPPAAIVTATAGPLALAASQTSSRARARPALTQSPSPGTVPNAKAKRARPGPGTIDLSSLPRFPIVQQAAACTPDQTRDEREQASRDGSQSSMMMGLLTPHAAAGPEPGEGGLERTGSASSSRTPRALPERPGLLSRWSSDSESSRNSSAGGSGSGSCDGEDCSECIIAFGQLGAASDDDDDENDDSDASEAAEAYFQNAARRASADTEFEYDDILSPLPASPSAMPPASRRLGCDATMSPDWMQLPPAPKPHQHGFSPFWEAPSHNSTPTLPSQAQADRSLSLSGESSSGGGAGHGRRGRKHGCGKHALVFSSSSGTSSPSSDSSSPASSPGFVVPHRSRTAGQAGSGSGSGPLTRSQGLRIRDEGSRAMRGRYARSLSAHAQASFAAPGTGINSSGAGGVSTGRESDVMRTASALLGGTISPAATTTDPLRVRLREMPGAITPDSLPSSPAALALGHHVQAKAPAVQHHYQLPAHSAHWLASVGRLPSSPLHISSLPDESGSDEDENDDGSEEGRRKAMSAAHRQRDTKHDIFSSSFSLAAPCPPHHHHHNHYARGPSPLASPCAVLTRSSGADTDADADTDKGSTGSTTGLSATHASAAAASVSSWTPAAAGRAGKTNPYFAGFV